MGGAYTAKPDAVVIPDPPPEWEGTWVFPPIGWDGEWPDPPEDWGDNPWLYVPPSWVGVWPFPPIDWPNPSWSQPPAGWNPNWAFPGPPNPPGWTPNNLITLTADTAIVPGGSTQSVTAYVSDGTYRTTQPSGQLIFTATLDGAPLQLGTSPFADSVLTDYIESDGFWSSSPVLHFDIDASDIGKIITLTANGSPFGNNLSASADIEIVAIPIPGIIVDPTSGLVTTKVGGAEFFFVVLLTQPSSGVSITLHSSNDSEGQCDISEVVFTPGNWDIPQCVTITGQDNSTPPADEEFIPEHDIPYSIILEEAVSLDAGYSGLKPDDVSVANHYFDVHGNLTRTISVLITEYPQHGEPYIFISASALIADGYVIDPPNYAGRNWELVGEYWSGDMYTGLVSGFWGGVVGPEAPYYGKISNGEINGVSTENDLQTGGYQGICKYMLYSYGAGIWLNPNP